MHDHKPICHYCIFHCMDYRIQSIVENLLKALQINMGDYDRLSIPGGAANLGQLFEDLRLSRKLHDTHQVILTTHEDCGYGATRESLTEAIDTARILYPDSKIRAFYLYLDGTWEEIAC